MKQSWVQDFYHECGREIGTNLANLHTISSWTLTGGAALVSALVIEGGFPDLPSYALLVLGTALFIRFLVRSMLVYGNVERFNKLQKAALKYLRSGKDEDMQQLDELIERLYEKWESPVPVLQLINSNGVLVGSAYVFSVLLAAIAYSAVVLRTRWEAQLITYLGVAVLGTEVLLFVSSRYFTHRRLATREKTPATRKWGFAIAGGILLSVALLALASGTLYFNQHDISNAIQGAWRGHNPTPTPTPTAGLSPAE